MIRAAVGGKDEKEFRNPKLFPLSLTPRSLLSVLATAVALSDDYCTLCAGNRGCCHDDSGGRLERRRRLLFRSLSLFFPYTYTVEGREGALFNPIHDMCRSPILSHVHIRRSYVCARAVCIANELMIYGETRTGTSEDGSANYSHL